MFDRVSVVSNTTNGGDEPIIIAGFIGEELYTFGPISLDQAYALSQSLVEKVDELDALEEE